MTENNSFNTNKGLIRIGNVKTLDSPIYISLDVEEVTESLRAEITEAIVDKVIDLKGSDWEYFGTADSWCEEHMALNWCFLSIELDEEKPVEYGLHINVYDEENTFFDIWVDVPLQMEMPESELKAVLLNLLMKKFYC